MTKGTEVKYIQVEKEPFTNLSDVPTSYVGQANKTVIVASGEGGLTFGAGGVSAEDVQDIVGDMVLGNTETGISVTYDDAGAKLNFDASHNHTGTYALVASGVLNGNLHDHLGGDGASVTESGLYFADVTFNNVTTGRHGLTPKATGSNLDYFRGDGTWATVSGTSSPWTTLMCTADQTVTNSATLVSSTYMTLTTIANTNYHIRLRVFWNTTNATADFKYRVRHTGTTTRVRRLRTYTVASGTSATYPTASFDLAAQQMFDSTDQTLTATVAGNGIVYEDIIVQVGASGGTLDFQFAQNTQTSAQSVTVYEGSYMEYMTT